jgi:hypothetical protein
LTANAIGIAVYLQRASIIWVPPGREGEPGGPGDPIIWGLAAGWILMVFLVLNMGWLVLIARAWFRNKQWKPILLWILVGSLWFGATRYDSSRSFNGSDLRNYDSQKR